MLKLKHHDTFHDNHDKQNNQEKHKTHADHEKRPTDDHSHENHGRTMDAYYSQS